MPSAPVHFVARTTDPITTDTNMLRLLPEMTLQEMPHPDILLVPGAAEGFRAVMEDQATLDWIRTVHATSRWTTSVCTGALILGTAGVLQGLEATTHWAAIQGLTLHGATPTSQRVVKQGKVITAAGVSAGIDMALHLAAEVAGEDTAKVIQLIIEYDPQPPFDSGAPQKTTEDIVQKAIHQLTGGARQSAPAPRV